MALADGGEQCDGAEDQTWDDDVHSVFEGEKGTCDVEFHGREAVFDGHDKGEKEGGGDEGEKNEEIEEHKELACGEVRSNGSKEDNMPDKHFKNKKEEKEEGAGSYGSGKLFRITACNSPGEEQPPDDQKCQKGADCQSSG